MKSVELIIFDLDGTLVDSKEAIAKGVNFALKKVGLKEKSVSQIASYIGIGVEDLIIRSLGPEQVHLLARTKTIFEDYRKQYPDSSVLYPGVKDVLEYFKNKRKVIITNRKYEFALLSLKALSIDGYFAAVMGGDELVCKKPSACPLETVIKRFKVNKEKAIMVGDMDIDILAGKAAGIFTCAVTYGIGKKDDIIKAKPDFIIDRIQDLKNIIG